MFFLCFFLKFFLILRAKSGRKSFFRSPAAFSDEVVVYFFRPQEGKAHRERQNEDKKFFHGSLQIQLPREEEIGDEVENDADDQLATRATAKMACLPGTPGEARPRREARSQKEICQNRDGRELHELEEHEDGHGGEGALVLIEAEADGVRRVDDEGNGGDAQDAEEEELQREEQRLPLHRAVQLAEGAEEVGCELPGPPANH